MKLKLKASQQIERKSWEEFCDEKLLWWINRSLHLFGWAIVVEMAPDNTVTSVYPARVKFRGFDSKTEEEGFLKLNDYLKNNAEKLAQEILE